MGEAEVYLPPSSLCYTRRIAAPPAGRGFILDHRLRAAAASSLEDSGAFPYLFTHRTTGFPV